MKFSSDIVYSLCDKNWYSNPNARSSVSECSFVLYKACWSTKESIDSEGWNFPIFCDQIFQYHSEWKWQSGSIDRYYRSKSRWRDGFWKLLEKFSKQKCKQEFMYELWWCMENNGLIGSFSHHRREMSPLVSFYHRLILRVYGLLLTPGDRCQWM